jgi:hypothetical protein
LIAVKDFASRKKARLFALCRLLVKSSGNYVAIAERIRNRNQMLWLQIAVSMMEKKDIAGGHFRAAI